MYNEPHQEAIRTLRKFYFGRKLTYNEVAEQLTHWSGKRISKARAWNLEHRDRKCPRHVRDALVQLGLLAPVERKRLRFFYEVDESEYQKIREFLGDRSFTEYMRNEGDKPWLD